MPSIRSMCCLLILTACLPITALSDPLCVPAGSVLEIPDKPLHGRPTKLSPDQAKAYMAALPRGKVHTGKTIP